MGNKNGRVLHEGSSALNGEPIVVVATGFTRPSTNPKTGPAIHTWILPNGSKAGAVESNCGDCKLRPGACYVNWGQAPAAVLRSYKAGNYEPMSLSDTWRLEHILVRMGSAGDPVAAPLEMWSALVDAAKSWVGYTHQWKDPKFSEFRNILMASVDSPQEKAEAISLGWRTFRTILPWEMVHDDEILCPASEEAGMRTNCTRCRLCAGTSIDAKNIAIQVHGSAGKILAYSRIRSHVLASQ